MTDTLFADVSSWNPDVSDQYPYQFIAIRSNDGTYQDQHFAYNLAWAKHACDTGKMAGFIVYFVWETNWQDTISTFKSMVGTPHRKMAVMLDVESWGGRITGNQSGGINQAREGVIAWLGGSRQRVGGYGNAGDLASLWPQRGDAWINLANYSANPYFPGKLIHQYSDKQNTPPFGPCDINSADGLSPAQLADRLGLVDHPVAPATPDTDRLVAGQELLAGSDLVAKDGSHRLAMQKDGNLVVYNNHTGKPVWASGTNRKPAAKLCMQSDGNLVIYSTTGKVLWSPMTNGKGGNHLVMQVDGNLVLYRADGRPVWQTRTNGD